MLKTENSLISRERTEFWFSTALTATASSAYKTTDNLVDSFFEIWL